MTDEEVRRRIIDFEERDGSIGDCACGFHGELLIIKYKENLYDLPVGTTLCVLCARRRFDNRDYVTRKANVVRDEG